MRRVILGTCVWALVSAAPIGSWAAERAAGSLPAKFSAGGCRAAAAPATGTQVQVDARTGMVASAGITADGRGALALRAGELEVTKTVLRDGRFALVLQAQGDRVRVEGQDGRLQVSRGGRTVVVEGAASTEDVLIEAQMLLAGSRAVRRLRGLVARVDPAAARTGLGAGLGLADALIGLLAGDVGALDRLGRQIAASRRPMLRAVRLGAEPGCYDTWLAEVLTAWDRYEDCRASFSTWNPLKEACSFAYLFEAEVAWFELLNCAGSPFQE